MFSELKLRNFSFLQLQLGLAMSMLPQRPGEIECDVGISTILFGLVILHVHYVQISCSQEFPMTFCVLGLDEAFGKRSFMLQKFLCFGPNSICVMVLGKKKVFNRSWFICFNILFLYWLSCVM